MKKLKLLFFFFSLLVFFFFSSRCLENSSLNAKSLDEIQKEIEGYEQELSRLSAQSKTLQNQIAQFDAQIRLTSLKITQTEEKIVLLGGRIDQLEVSLTALSKAFSSRAVETYKMARVQDPLLILVSAPDLTEAVSRFHYLRRIQEADRDLLQRLQVTQTNYKQEKSEQEILQEELVKQKKNLDTQKIAKASLLAQTKNDEKRYQQLLAQAFAEKAAIEKALVSGVKVGPVKQGDPIGLVGNTGYPGCSTGKHLHFEVQRNNSWTDPAPFLQNKSVRDEQNPGGNMVAIGSGN